MNPLKICMVTTFYPPHNFGGDGIFVYRLANALARRGHDVHVLHDLDAFALLSDHLPKPSYPNEPNITLYPLTSRGIGPIDLFLSHQLGRPMIKTDQIRGILEATGFDVIHYHNISLLGGPKVLEYGKAIKLCTVHDYWFVCSTHVLWRFDREPCANRTCLTCTLQTRRPPQYWRYNGAIDRAGKHVDAFIGPSDFSREIHEANGFSHPIRSIPHFLPDNEVGAHPGSPTNEGKVIGSQVQRPYFLFVGRLEKIKGVQILLEIFRSYVLTDLIIAGTGTYEGELRNMASGMQHVHFMGLQDQSRLRALYAEAIATLVPSLCYESFGWATLESFVNHTPVIAHNIGALPEVIGRGGGGLVYDAKEELVEAMERLRNDRALREQLGEQGFASFTEHYTEEKHIQRYYDLLREIRERSLPKDSPE